MRSRPQVLASSRSRWCHRSGYVKQQVITAITRLTSHRHASPSAPAVVPLASSPSSSSTPSPSPAPSPSPSPSSAPTSSPSPTMPFKTMADLIAAKHPKTSETAVLSAIKAAFTADPVGWGNGQSLAGIEQGIEYCAKGDPTTTGGDPYENRVLDCGNVITQEYHDYEAQGVEADYAAALAAYNFGYNTFSNVKGRNYWMDEVTLLEQQFSKAEGAPPGTKRARPRSRRLVPFVTAATAGAVRWPTSRRILTFGGTSIDSPGASLEPAPPRPGSPLVSVIVPAYQGERYIEEALRSALDGTIRDIEVIVVDDGSTDATAAIAERLAADDDRVRFVRQGHRGASAARNTALAMARGRWAALLDQDDVWLPRRLERQLAFLAGNPDVAVLGTYGWHIGPTGRRTGVFAAGPRSREGAHRPARPERGDLPARPVGDHGPRGDPSPRWVPGGLPVGQRRRAVDPGRRRSRRPGPAGAPVCYRVHEDATSIRRFFEQQELLLLIARNAGLRRAGRPEVDVVPSYAASCMPSRCAGASPASGTCAAATGIARRARVWPPAIRAGRSGWPPPRRSRRRSCLAACVARSCPSCAPSARLPPDGVGAGRGAQGRRPRCATPSLNGRCLHLAATTTEQDVRYPVPGTPSPVIRCTRRKI